MRYTITGVWKDDNGLITHYAIHELRSNVIYDALKYTKSEAIELLEKNNNTAVTSIWNYQTAGWYIGEEVEVVHGDTEKYLRSNPDMTETNNLGHLIIYSLLPL